MKKQTVASVIVSMLKAIGVDRAYAVSGESYLALLDELERDATIDVVTCRHEGGAGLMAVADAKLTGTTGVCMVSRGPGAANATLGVVAAREDTVPFILFIGQVEKSLLRRDGFQELDYSQFFQGTVKWAAEIRDPDRVVDIMVRAIRTARSGTPGPVVISLPEDVLGAETAAFCPDIHDLEPASPSTDSVAQVMTLIRGARQPLIVAGGELANAAGRRALLATAETLGIPVTVSFRRLDLFPNAHPLFAGELGFFNTAEQMVLLQESDLVIAVGTRLGDLTTHGYTFPDSARRAQPLVHVHRDAAVLSANYAPDVAIPCDAQRFLAALSADRDARPVATNPEWAPRLRTALSRITQWHAARASDGVVFGNVVAELGQYIKTDAIVALDAGVSAAMMYRHYPFKTGQILLTPITGAMGFGIPAAVAASLRYPQRQVICVIGDGGMLMGGNELAVALERNLPLVILLANNVSYGAIRVNLDRSYPGRSVATRLANPDFQQLGRAYGCKTLKISNEDEVVPMLREAFAERCLTFVEVKTSLNVVLPSLRRETMQS